MHPSSVLPAPCKLALPSIRTAHGLQASTLQLKYVSMLCHVCSLQRLSACNLVQAHEVDATNTTASFRQFHVDQIGADMKESICRVSDTPFDAQENAHVPTVSYEVNLSLPTIQLQHQKAPSTAPVTCVLPSSC